MDTAVFHFLEQFSLLTIFLTVLLIQVLSIELGYDFGTHSQVKATLEEQFWSYFTSEDKHDFMKPGSEDETRAFTAPPREFKNPEN